MKGNEIFTTEELKEKLGLNEEKMEETISNEDLLDELKSTKREIINNNINYKIDNGIRLFGDLVIIKDEDENDDWFEIKHKTHDWELGHEKLEHIEVISKEDLIKQLKNTIKKVKKL